MENRLQVKPYQDLRAETQARDRGLREKVMSLEEAAALVADGDHVAIGGCTMSRTPMAMIWALIRQGRRDLIASRNIMSNEGDLLLASGVSSHVVTSWFSQGIVWGISKVMRLHVETGKARFDEWSHMAMGLRYRAGAMGVPFLPARSMMGSDVGKRTESETREIICPFTSEKLLLLPALNPDVAIIHVQRADPYGNAQIDGLPFMDMDIAMAATKVILTTERIIDNAQIRRAPDRTRIPFFTADAVVEAPFGCAPHECYGTYEPFFDQMNDYAKLVSADPDKGAASYLKNHFYDTATWEDYLERFGTAAMLDASRRGRSIYDD
mgnify:FL=1